MSATFTYPSVFAYSKSLAVTDFRMFGAKSGASGSTQLLPVLVRERRTRGPSSSFTADPAAAAQAAKNNIRLPNLQLSDRAFLPSGTDTLVVTGGVDFYSHVQLPESINEPDYYNWLKRFITAAARQGVFKEIATRFVINMVRGRFIWRNAVLGPVSVKVKRILDGSGEMLFDSERLLGKSGFSLELVDESAEHRAFATTLRDDIEAVFAGQRRFLKLELTATVLTGPGREVYPSQLMLSSEDSQGKEKDKKSKVLATLEAEGSREPQAVIRPEKVANRIKEIDDWYGLVPGEAVAAIPVSAYGLKMDEEQAFRQKNSAKASDANLYAYLMHIDEIVQELESGVASARAYYTAAMLIQGGVFGIKEEKSTKILGETEKKKNSKATKA